MNELPSELVATLRWVLYTKKKCMEKGDTMEKMIEKMEKCFFLFEKETDETKKERKAQKIVEIYDLLDFCLLSEEEDNWVLEMYSQAQEYLSLYWEVF